MKTIRSRPFDQDVEPVGQLNPMNEASYRRTARTVPGALALTGDAASIMVAIMPTANESPTALRLCCFA